MRGKVFLVQWDATSAAERADTLRREGWKVDVECENGGRAYRHIRTSVPDVVVLDLGKKPSHGREVGSALRAIRATRDIPIVCIEEGDEAREQTRLRIEGVRFSTDGDLPYELVDAAHDHARASRRLKAVPRTSHTSSPTRR